MSRWLVPTLTALTASSCCVVQLVLNVFSISCAGFAVFTPYRSLLTAWTLISVSFILWKRGGRSYSDVIALLVVVCLLISPEIVEFTNRHSRSTMDIPGTFYLVGVKGISCMACANRIKNTVDSLDWVDSVSVFFENNSVVVQTAHPYAYRLLPEMIQSIEPLKYQAVILNSW